MDVLLFVILGAVVAGFVQGLSGFGFAMTAIAIWAWVLEPRLVATLGVWGALCGQVFTALTVRRGFQLRVLAPFLAGAACGLPLGLYLLPRMDIPMYKTALGAILVVVCPLMFFTPRLPHIHRGGRIGDAVSGVIGGVMGGLGGSTGVVPTLWSTLRGWDKENQRSIIQNFNLAALAVTFAAYLGTGIVTRDMLPAMLVAVPAVVIPSIAGRRLYARISDRGFRQVVLGLLTAGGAALLASGVSSLLQRG